MAIISFVNQHVNWRWTYYSLIIWAFLQTVALICVCLVEPCCGAVSERISQFVPETYTPVILKWKAQRYVHLLLRCDRDLTLSHAACEKQGGTVIYMPH
jgi:hypothetical protein